MTTTGVGASREPREAVTTVRSRCGVRCPVDRWMPRATASLTDLTQSRRRRCFGESFRLNYRSRLDHSAADVWDL